MFKLPGLIKLLGLMMIVTGLAHAQRYTSPPAKVSATVAGKHISVDYYAPSMHGRKIMGDLVPFGEVWCPGANVATGLTTEGPLQFGTLKLPKGTWSIWAIPGEKEWTLIVNKQSGQSQHWRNVNCDPGVDSKRQPPDSRRYPHKPGKDTTNRRDK